jgi:hypothetical protein
VVEGGAEVLEDDEEDLVRKEGSQILLLLFSRP